MPQVPVEQRSCFRCSHHPAGFVVIDELKERFTFFCSKRCIMLSMAISIDTEDNLQSRGY